MTIFQQPFWLDAVAPGKWGAVEIQRGGVLQARLPYVEKKLWGSHKELVMPSLTQVLGPWLQPSDSKYATQISAQHELLSELIEGLPAFDYFRQNFHHSITNWLPFYWKGFQQTTRYTYVIESLTDLDLVWAELRKNTRHNIREAKKKLILNSDYGIDTLLKFVRMTFARQGLSQPYSDDLVYRIHQACTEKHCAKLFCAEDDKGRIHGALYIIWDEDAAYSLASGSDPELRNSSADSFLLWEAIRFAATVTKSFDFEGSMMQSIEIGNRGFGAKQKPYFQVSKYNSLLPRMRHDIHSWLDMMHGK